MIHLIKISGIFLILNLGICFQSAAEAVSYTKLSVKGRVQIEIPSDWSISDTEQRKRVKELGEKIIGIPIDHMASLAAQSYPPPSRTMVRVSFIPLQPPISQSEVRKEVQANKQQVLNDLAEGWREEAPTMWSGLAKNGVRQVGSPSFAVEPLGGQMAMIISYARTSTVHPSETMKVTQYHIPMGAEKVLITLSYIDGDQQALAAHNRLKSSISIR